MTAVALPRAFHQVVGATGLSNLADGIRMAVFPLLAATLTDSAAVVAVVFAAGQLPWLVLGLWAGKLADRCERRQLVQSVAVARTATLLLLAGFVFAELTPLWMVVVSAFILGAGEVLADTASGTLVPILVPTEQLERANSRMVVAEITGNELVGPALGGLLFGVGVSLPFFTNAFLLACAVLFIAGLPLLDPPTAADTNTPDSRPSAFDGLAYIRGHLLLRTVTWTSAVLAAVDAAWFALLVLFVRDHLGYGSAAFGLFLAVGAVGGLAGALVADRCPSLKLTTLTQTTFVTMAVSLVALGIWSLPIVTALTLAVTSGGIALWNVLVVSCRQRATPIEMLGRVGAAYRTIVISAALVGALAGGILADAFSIRSALVAYGILLALLTPLASRQFSAALS